MSYHVVDAVLETRFPDLPPSSGRRFGVTEIVLKLVCLVLAEAANHDGTGAHPGLRRLARRASVTTDTARIALDGLLEIGAIRLERAASGKNPDTFAVVLDALPGLLITADGARVTRARGQRVTRALRAGDPRSSARVTRAISLRPIHPVSPSVDSSTADAAADAVAGAEAATEAMARIRAALHKRIAR